MDSHGCVHVLQIPFVHVIVAAHKHFLRRLKQQFHPAGQGFPAFPQQPGRSQKHGRVAVVAAGVHHSRMNAGKLHPAFLLNGKGVNIRPQQQGLSRLCPLNHGDAAGVVLKGHHGDPHFFQLRHEKRRGFPLLIGELRVTVEIVAVFHNLLFHLFCLFQKIHTQLLFYLKIPSPGPHPGRRLGVSARRGCFPRRTPLFIPFSYQ